MAPSCGPHLSTVELPSQWSSFQGEGHGNLDLLAELVKWNPVALGFPNVFNKIFALRRVLNQAGEEDLDRVDGECVTLANGQEKLIARGEKRDAEKALYNIRSVWIQRMLPGHTVGGPLKVRTRRGRPHKLRLLLSTGNLPGLSIFSPGRCRKARWRRTRYNALNRRRRTTSGMKSWNPHSSMLCNNTLLTIFALST
jgi:hypothetical protein